MSLKSEGVTVAAYAEQQLQLADASLGDEFYYQSLPLCVIDAVFSIGVRYSGVQKVVARYCDYTGQRRVRAGNPSPPTADQESISTFCDRPEQADPVEMAEKVYRNRQRTSTQGGILKADAVTRFARCLRSHSVEFLQDVPRFVDNPQFEGDIRGIPGQRSGISLQYFWMLAGSDQFVKPDRMVLRFLEAALSRPVAVREAATLLCTACEHLVVRYPHLTPRLLDYEVWKHQQAV